ncbi:hypothetical protein Tco_0893058 [Tanacetum coccineum]|uniref:Uncharacterized protein n=1 Tax=Tanacetum coccineum TaxID=301880 RepID=A0ABQ5C7Q6_9ASTR
MGNYITIHGDKVALTIDEGRCDVAVYLIQIMIGSLMYLTASRPDIMISMDMPDEVRGVIRSVFCQSSVKQFWQTATAKTLTDGTLELHATIDTIVYTITEASIRNKLHLEDASGITMLPNNEIFEGDGGIWGQEHPDVAQSQPSSSTIPVPSTSSPPMTVDDLLRLVPQLVTRIDSLETDLKQTKLTMGSDIVKLVKKVKKLEGEGVQEKASTDTELFIQEVTPTKVIQDQEALRKQVLLVKKFHISTAEVMLVLVWRNCYLYKKGGREKNQDKKRKAHSMKEERAQERSPKKELDRKVEDVQEKKKIVIDKGMKREKMKERVYNEMQSTALEDRIGR